ALDEQLQQVTLTLQAAPFNPCNVAAADQKQLTITPDCQDAIANAGADLTVCYSGAIALNATAQNQTSILWNTSGDGTFDANTNSNANYFPGTADRANGNVQLCITAFANGECSDATDCLTLTFSNPPVVNAGADITTCATSSFVTLNGQAQNYQSFQWTTLGTGYFMPPTSRTPKYFPSGLDKLQGEVKLIFKATNATCGVTRDTLTVTINNPPVVYAGTNATICASEPFINSNATAVDFSELLWTTSGDGTFDNASMLHATYYAGTNDMMGGSVTLTLAAAGEAGCQQAQSSFILTFIPLAYANAGEDFIICATQNASLAGQAADYESLLWETSGDGTFANAEVLSTTYFPGAGDLALGHTEISLTANAFGNCGSAVSELQINIQPVPEVDAGNDQQICAGNLVQLSATAANYASIIWSTNGDGSFNNTSALNAIYTPGTADIIYGSVGLCLTANGLMGCPESISCTSIEIKPNPLANAGEDAVAITGQQYFINDATAQYQSAVVWTTSGSGVFGNANALSTTYTPSALDEQLQQVTLTLQAAPLNPCNVAAADQKQLTITPDCQDAIANAGADLTVCYSGAIALNATAQNQTSILWNTSGDGTFDANTNSNANYFPGTADRANGNVQLCITAFAGGLCNDASDCLEIVFGDLPVINAGDDATACITEDFIPLTGTVVNGVVYQWTTTGQGFFAPANQLVTKYFISFYDKFNGYVDLVLAATNSPCETVYDTLRVTFHAEPIVYAGEDATICGNEEYMLFEAFAAEYQSLQWITAGDGTFEDAGALNTVYYPGANDVVDEEVELQLVANPLEGCLQQASSFVLTLIPSAYANAGNDLTICETGTATLLGQAADYESLLWETSGDGIFTNAFTPNTTYMPGAGDMALGEVVVSLTAFSSGNCGDAVNELIIKILPVPTANAGDDMQICAGDVVQLSATAANYATIIWSTNGDGVFDNPSALNANYTPGAADLQNNNAVLCLTAASAAACTNATSCIEVIIQQSPTANAGADAVICQNQIVQLSASAAHNIGAMWSTAGDGSFSNAALPNAIYTPGTNDIGQGSVVLTFTAFAGGVCADAMDEMLLTIQPAPSIYAGTDFTICESTFAQLSATGINYNTLLWSTAGDGTFDNAALSQATYFPGSQDKIVGFANLTITVQGISPCIQVADGLTVTFQSSPVVSVMDDVAICPDQIITVEAAGANYQSVLWSTDGDGTFATPQALSSEYFPGANDVVAGGADLCITATGLYGCAEAEACLHLQFIGLPSVNSGNDVSICNTAIATLSAQASNYEMLQWMTDGDGTFSAASALITTYSPGINDIAEGSVKVCLNAFAANDCGQSQDCLIITLQTPPTVDAGIDQTLCMNQNAVIAGTSANASSVLWSTMGDGTFANSSAPSTTYYPGATDLVNLSAELCLTAQSGGSCEPVTDCLVINFQPGPTAFAGNDVTVCANQNIPLQAVATGYSSVFWNTGGTGSFSNPQVLNPTYFPSQADKNNGFVQLSIKAYGSNGCGFVTDVIAITIVPVPVANAGADATTCQTTPYILNGSAQNTIATQWTTNGDGTFDDPTALATVYTPGTNDVVVGYVNLCLQAMGQSPCIATNDCMKLTIMKSPTANAGADIVICAGNEAALQGQATNQLSVLWSTSGDGTFANANVLSTTYFPGATDISNGGAELCLTAFGKANCVAVSECLSLSIVPVPVAYAGMDATIEQGQSHQLQQAAAQNYSQILWHTSGTGVFTNIHDVNATYTPSNYDVGQGSAVLKMEAMPENPCVVSVADDMTLSITATTCIDAEADAGNDLTICTGTNVLIENAEIYFAETVLWSTSGDGTFDDASLENPVYFPGTADNTSGKVTLCVQAFAAPPCLDAADCVELTILQNAVAYAGGDNSIPQNTPYQITDTWAENSSMILWFTTNGMGFFENPTSINPTYIPSPYDIYQDTIHLAMAVMSINPCVMDYADEMALFFTETGGDAQADAGANITRCGNDSIVALSGSASGYKALQWTTSGDGTFDHPNAAVGNYKLGAADRDANEITLYLQAIAFEEYAWAIDSLIITKAVAPVAFAGADQTICEGAVVETSLAFAENYANVVWTTSGDGTFDNAASIITIYTPGVGDAANAQVELTLTASALAPCTNIISSSFVLTINPLPTFLTDLSDTYVILGESIVLNMDVENATGYQWYGPAGMIAGAEMPELFIAQAAAEDEGYYYFEVFNACGTVTSNMMYLQVYDQQIVMIPAGWSGLSSWIVPGNPNLEDIFAPYQNTFIIARNFSGMYYPGANINTLNFWNPQMGYTINFNDDVIFALAGDENTNRTITMATGWNYLPVISSCPVNVADFFATVVTKVQMIKEIAGSGIYWPAAGVNTLGELQPGRAYQLKALEPFSITFESCAEMKSSGGAAHLQPKYDTPWNDVHYSPASHSIAIHNDLAAMLQPGDILSAFTTSGVCAGAQQITDFGNAIVLFADDELTAGVDGFAENETIRFEVVRPATGEQFVLEVAYDQAYACHDGQFVSGGVSAINKSSATAITTLDEVVVVSVYPNPTSGMVYVSGVKSDMQIEFRNVSGQVLQTIPCRFDDGENRVAVDVSSFASGVIYMRIYNSSQVIHHKLIVK
ncbi:MAG: T9SS type A sorting domain-containing protein, partial [Clostridia bacterium]|nr:T9SS type A sorting domain-containing protein [Clostridia bacterium]